MMPQLGYGGMQPGGSGPPIFPGGQGGIGGGTGGLGVGLPAGNPAAGAANTDFLKSVFGSFQNATDAANAANQQRYNQVLQGYGQLAGQQANALGGLAGLYGNRTNDFASAASNILGGYGNRLNSAAGQLNTIGNSYNQLLNNQMSRLGLLGQTEATNLNQAFNQSGAQQQQGLVDRGLGNTTVTTALQRGNELDRQRALTNLAQNVAQQMNQTEMGAALPGLQFQQQATGTLADLSGQGLGAAGQFTGDIANLQGQALDFGNQANQQQMGLGQNQLNFIANRNDIAPDYNTLVNLANGIGMAGALQGNPNLLQGLQFPQLTQGPGPLPNAQLPPITNPQQQQLQPPPNYWAQGTAA